MRTKSSSIRRVSGLLTRAGLLIGSGALAQDAGFFVTSAGSGNACGN